MSTKLRLLLVSEPGIDGVFRHVEGLTHYCLRQGIETHLAYSDERGSAGLQKLLAAVRAAGGETLNLRVGNAPAPRDLPAFLRLRAFANRLRPDVIHGHSSKAGALVRMLRGAGWRGPLFYSPHAYYGLARRGSRLKSALYNGIERLFAGIGTTINISRDEAAFARATLGLDPARARTIHNPVDTAIFAPARAEQRRKRRAELGLPATGVVLGFIGRSSFQKDPQTLYRALAPVLAAHPEAVLFHVGQGELDAELAALAGELGIASRIIRKPYLEEPAGFYEAVDALVFTSRYEAGWPLVVLEALACDLPLVASIAPGTSDIADGGLSHCWTAPAEDAAGFTRGVEAWLADRAADRVCNHRAIAIARFGTEKCLGAVVAEYRKAIS